MKFTVQTRYFSKDGYEIYVTGRRETTMTGANCGEKNPRIYAQFGFAIPQLYKIRTDRSGVEYVEVKSHIFRADH